MRAVPGSRLRHHPGRYGSEPPPARCPSERGVPGPGDTWLSSRAGTAGVPAGFSVEDIPGGDRDLIGLARVSTDGQDAQLQRDDLRGAGCGRIYDEKASTRKATADRPGLAPRSIPPRR